jgi:hypothetical protein
MNQQGQRERGWTFNLPLPVRFEGIEEVRPPLRRRGRRLRQRALRLLVTLFNRKS